MTEKTKEVVINSTFGGFGLSDLAYEKLIEWGIPLKKYIKPKRNHKTGLYEKEEDEKVIYTGGISFDKYWEAWLKNERENPLLIRVIKELGKKASGRCASLKIIEIPTDIEYEIEEYDGNEWISEKHKTWR